MSIPWSAPEVIAEQTAGTVASEVWSLGATVYSLLAGHSPFERRERGQNTKEQLRRRIARATYIDIARTDVPASLQAVLARAMSRDPRQRYASAREFAEALRGVQTELGISPTPLEIAADEWSPASGPVDFADTELRGPARSRIERDERRKTRPGTGVAGLARDEDTDFSAPDRASAGAAVGRGGGRRVVVVGGTVTALLRDGGALMRRRTVAGLSRRGPRSPSVAGVSIVWPGLDAQETAKTDTSVWALQTGEVRRYARVNTTVGELDTVRNISDPSQVAQTADGVYLFSDSFTRLTGSTPRCRRIWMTWRCATRRRRRPERRTSPPRATSWPTEPTPVRSSSAGCRRARRPSSSPSRPRTRAPQYTADAIALDERGMLFSYSIADRSVLQYDIRASELRARDPLETDAIAAPAISAAGDAWAVVDTTDGEVWLGGRMPPISTPTTASVLVGQPDPGGSAVYLADETALVRVPLDGSGVTTEEGDGAGLLGTPARPIVHDGEVFAAWLPEGGGRCAVELAERAVGARLRRGGAARRAAPHVRRERRRRHPERDAHGVGVDGARRRARRVQPGLVARRAHRPRCRAERGAAAAS